MEIAFAALLFMFDRNFVTANYIPFSELIALETSLLNVASMKPTPEVRPDKVAMDIFDDNQAVKSLWLCAASQCPIETYKTRVFVGPTRGFVVTDVIHDVTTDVQG